jgi:hypothetical protein
VPEPEFDFFMIHPSYSLKITEQVRTTIIGVRIFILTDLAGNIGERARVLQVKRRLIKPTLMIIAARILR